MYVIPSTTPDWARRLGGSMFRGVPLATADFAQLFEPLGISHFQASSLLKYPLLPFLEETNFNILT